MRDTCTTFKTRLVVILREKTDLKWMTLSGTQFQRMSHVEIPAVEGIADTIPTEPGQETVVSFDMSKDKAKDHPIKHVYYNRINSYLTHLIFSVFRLCQVFVLAIDYPFLMPIIWQYNLIFWLL